MYHHNFKCTKMYSVAQKCHLYTQIEHFSIKILNLHMQIFLLCVNKIKVFEHFQSQWSYIISKLRYARSEPSPLTTSLVSGISFFISLPHSSAVCEIEIVKTYVLQVIPAIKFQTSPIMQRLSSPCIMWSVENVMFFQADTYSAYID